MITTHRQIEGDLRLEADVCIVGSGAGGSAAAHALSKAGKKVVVLERGSFFTPKDFTQREEQMFPRLFYDAGGRRTKNRAIRVLHGMGVGGSTLHNINLCKRMPDEVIGEWQLERFTAGAFKPYLDRVEMLLGVSRIEEHRINPNNAVFRKGVEKLGYRGGMLSHNRKDCVGSGFCELGCAYDAKLNAMRALLPEAIRLGAEVVADTRALSFVRSGRRIERVVGEAIDPATQRRVARVEVKARQFICSGGAIESAVLLLRSDLPDPHGLIGQRLHLHPGVAVAGVFDERINSWQGIPQSYECTEFLNFDPDADQRVWIISGSAHPAGAASMLPGFGETHRELMRLFPHFAPLSAMVHDQTRGTVATKGETGVTVDYVLNDVDRSQLALGLREISRILLSAGAREVLIPFTRLARVKSVAELESLDLSVRDGDLDIVSVHPMSTVWMGNSAEDSCLDDRGRYHHLDNLFVADTSVYPTSIGTPPQVSTFAVGLYVADQVLSG